MGIFCHATVSCLIRVICVYLRLKSLEPNIAVPTRTTVAPSSIATSKSWLMPIDSSPPGMILSRIPQSRLKYGRVASGSSKNGGNIIKPLNFKHLQPCRKSPSSAISLVVMPDFVSSPARSTCATGMVVPNTYPSITFLASTSSTVSVPSVNSGETYGHLE